jgi:hypothetical protein
MRNNLMYFFFLLIVLVIISVATIWCYGLMVKVLGNCLMKLLSGWCSWRRSFTHAGFTWSPLHLIFSWYPFFLPPSLFALDLLSLATPWLICSLPSFSCHHPSWSQRRYVWPSRRRSGCDSWGIGEGEHWGFEVMDMLASPGLEVWPGEGDSHKGRHWRWSVATSRRPRGETMACRMWKRQVAEGCYVVSKFI